MLSFENIQAIEKKAIIHAREDAEFRGEKFTLDTTETAEPADWASWSTKRAESYNRALRRYESVEAVRHFRATDRCGDYSAVMAALGHRLACESFRMIKRATRQMTHRRKAEFLHRVWHLNEDLPTLADAPVQWAILVVFIREVNKSPECSQVTPEMLDWRKNEIRNSRAAGEFKLPSYWESEASDPAIWDTAKKTWVRLADVCNWRDLQFYAKWARNAGCSTMELGQSRRLTKAASRAKHNRALKSMRG